MSNPHSDFWRAVVHMGGAVADRQRWRHHSISAPLFHQAGLLRDEGPASVVYRVDERGREQAYQVVRHAADDLVGVPVNDDDEAITLDQRDAINWGISWSKVRQFLYKGLHLKGAESPVSGSKICWRLGTTLIDVDISIAVYLTAGGTAQAITKAIDVISTSAHGPAVILVPSTEHMDGAVIERAAHRRVAVVSLADRTVLADRTTFHDQRLTGHPSRDTVFAEQRQWHGLEIGGAVHYAFQAVGEGWDLVFNGQSARIVHRKGMLYLHILLASSERHALAATALLAAVAGVDEQIFKSGAARQKTGEALKAINDRICEINEERDKAEGHNDYAQIGMLDEERQELLKEVDRQTNIHGEERQTGDTEKARLSVRKALRDAIKIIREHLPEMAQHLDESITYGHWITYAPKNGPPIWMM